MEEGAFAVELGDVTVRGDITISLFDRVPRTTPAIPMLFARLSFMTEDAAQSLPSAPAAGAETKVESVGDVTRFAWAAIDVADPAWQWVQAKSFARQIERDFYVDVVLLRAAGGSSSGSSSGGGRCGAADPLLAASSAGTDEEAASASAETLEEATRSGVASAVERSAAFEAERTVILAARAEREAEWNAGREGPAGALPRRGVPEPWAEEDDSDEEGSGRA